MTLQGIINNTKSPLLKWVAQDILDSSLDYETVEQS